MNPYADGETGTLKNKLGIRDPAQLRQVEYALTDLRVAQLHLAPIPGQFDLDHLRKTHAHIFGDIYEWAGKVRTVPLAKRDPQHSAWKSRFAPPELIDGIAHGVSEDLKSQRYLKGLSQNEFTEAITAVYAKVNYLHPFPEGNGRSTQTFLSQLAREAGYQLNFANIERNEWNRAAARSMPQEHGQEPSLIRKSDVSAIHQAFRKIVEPIREPRKEPEKGIDR